MNTTSWIFSSLGIIGILLFFIGISFSFTFSWISVLGIVLIGFFGGRIIYQQFMQLSIPVSRFSIRKREGIDYLSVLTKNAPTNTNFNKELAALDPYWHKELDRPVSHDLLIFATLRQRMGASDNKTQFTHFSDMPLQKIADFLGVGKLKWLIFVFGFLLVTILLATISSETHLFPTTFLEPIIVYGLTFTVICVAILATWLFSAFRDYNVMNSRNEEIIELFMSSGALLSFVIGFLAFLILWFQGTSQGWIHALIVSTNVDYGIILTLAGFLVTFWTISYLEGRFIVFWMLHLFWKSKNWDFMKGISIISQHHSTVDLLKSYGKRTLAITSLGGLIIGIITAISGLLSLFSTQPIADPSFIEVLAVQLPGPSAIYLIILATGPLLSILLKPFDFIEVWTYQSIHAKISSGWNPKSSCSDYLFYNDIARYPALDHNLGQNVVKICALLLGLFVITTTQVALTNLLPFSMYIEGLWLAQRSSEVVFFVGMIISFLHASSEAANIQLLAKYGHKYQRNLVNETLFGENLILDPRMSHDLRLKFMGSWVNENPAEWRLPVMFQGLMLLHLAAKGIDLPAEIKKYLTSSFEEALKPDGVLPSAMEDSAKKILTKFQEGKF